MRYVPVGQIMILTLGAVLYALSMPGKQVSLGMLSYIALIPLFFCLRSGNNLWNAAMSGLYFGTLSSFILLHWIKFTISEYGNLGDLIGYLTALFLSIYCGMFISFFSYLTGAIIKQFGERALLGMPILWAGIEILRVNLQIGFPWLLFGYSQYGDFYSRQFAAFGGVIGTGLLLVLINLLFFLFLIHVIEGEWKSSLPYMFAGIGVVLLLHLPGLMLGAPANSDRGTGKTIKVAAVQPNIDQWKKWDDQYQKETLDTLQHLTNDHMERDVRLVVWPETALPFFYYWEKEPTEEIQYFVKELQKVVLTGVPWYEAIDDGRYYNSIIMISPSGDVVDRYDKMKLVPFGEYIPFRRILFFIEKITEGAEDFSRGSGVKLLIWRGMKIIPSICYEAIFPQLSVDGVLQGGTVLVNVTNDAWFGDTVAPFQHLYMAAFRAVETGRYMIRCSNSGITASIDQFGNVNQKVDLFARGGITTEIRLLSGMTFYVKNARYIKLFIVGGSIILIVGISVGRFLHGRHI